MSRPKSIVFVLAVALAACGGKKEADKDKSGSAAPAMGSAAPAMGSAAPAMGSAAPAMGSAAPAMGSAAAVDVPTEEDFEGQAKTDITAATVDTKVKAIEDQLGQQ